MRTRLLLMLSLGLSSAACAHTSAVRYVKLVNTTKSSITSFGIASAGSTDFREAAIGNALHGGGESATVAIRDDGSCVRDLRTVFADGRVLIEPGFDVCKRDRYQPALSRARGNRALVAQP